MTAPAADDVVLVAQRHGIAAAAIHFGWSPRRIANELQHRRIPAGPTLIRGTCSCERCASWRHQAACRPHDTDLWFPVTNQDDHQAWDAPRAICQTCPVRQECEDHAVQHGLVNDGMWGGHTPNQLHRLRRRLQHHQRQEHTA